jgi:hypothetical protein
VTLCVCLVAPAGAQSDDDGAREGSFSGQALIGYRSVDVGGSEAKYREDINLEDGPVLFDLDVKLVPEGALRSFADEIYVDLGDLGSQPYETIRAGARKYGKYAFRYDRRESAYFYFDQLTSSDGMPVVDPRTFDLRRVRELAELDLSLGSSAKLSVGFDTIRRRGKTTDTPNLRRDTFVVEREVDDSLESFWGRFSYTWDKVTLLVQGKNREFDNPIEWVYTGEPEGSSETLDFLSYGTPYTYDSNEIRLQLLARPTPKLDIRITAERQDLDLETDLWERWSGTDRDGEPVAMDAQGDGTVEREIGLFDIDLTYLVGDRFGLVAGFRRSSLDQTGQSVLAETMNAGTWDIGTNAFEVGAQFLASGELTLTGGLLFEDRDVARGWTSDDEGEAEDRSTSNLGFFVDASWNPSRRLEVTADLDINAIDDPYTLASPTSRRRLRVRGRYRWESGLWASGSFSFNDFDNDNSGWSSDNRRGMLRLGYSNSALHVSGGYSSIRMERGVDRLLNDSTPFPIFYTADSDFFDARLRWYASSRLALVGEVFLYDNGGTFAVERQDYRAGVEYAFLESFVAGLSFRSIDFSQGETTFNDYDTRIVDFSLGYRW